MVNPVSSFDALCANEPDLATQRSRIRDFLRADRAEFNWEPSVDAWLSEWDPAFSARLGDAGFVGLTIPRSHGGQGLGYLHRYVITEELLAQGAPVAAHWIADRQVAPALLAYGTEDQRDRLLAPIAAGRLHMAIGMSEHEAGSDLAAVRTKATPTDLGWVLNGTKTWTSGAHRAHQIVILARTAALDPTNRHAGLSQFLLDLRTPGITISPVVSMSGEHHFNEVHLNNVSVPHSAVLGTVGNGWHQVTSELAFERSGPERVLSTAPLLEATISALAAGPTIDLHVAAMLGELLARQVSLRQLSVSVARTLADGGDAATKAALVKDLGTRFEQESVDIIADLLTYAPDRPVLRDLLAKAWLHKPVFTLRGGTNEVLRGVIAREMGLR